MCTLYDARFFILVSFLLGSVGGVQVREKVWQFNRFDMYIICRTY